MTVVDATRVSSLCEMLIDIHTSRVKDSPYNLKFHYYNILNVLLFCGIFWGQNILRTFFLYYN